MKNALKLTAFLALFMYGGAQASVVTDFNDIITFATGDRIFPCFIIKDDENGNICARIKSKLVGLKEDYDLFEANRVMLFKNKNYLVVHVQQCNQPHCIEVQLKPIDESEHSGVMYDYAYHISAIEADGTLFITIKTSPSRSCIVVPDRIVEIRGKKYEIEAVQKTDEQGCFSLKMVPWTQRVAKETNVCCVGCVAEADLKIDRPRSVVNITGMHNYQIESIGKNNGLYALIPIDAFSDALEEDDIIGTIDGVTYLIWSIEFSEIPGYYRVELSNESALRNTQESCDLVGMTGRFNYCIKGMVGEEFQAVIAKDAFNGEPRVGDLTGYIDGKKYYILSVTPSEVPGYVTVKLPLKSPELVA